MRARINICGVFLPPRLCRSIVVPAILGIADIHGIRTRSGDLHGADTLTHVATAVVTHTRTRTAGSTEVPKIENQRGQMEVTG